MGMNDGISGLSLSIFDQDATVFGQVSVTSHHF